MFWVYAENTVDNLGMFQLLLSRAFTVKSSTAPHLTESRLGVHEDLGGDTAGQLILTDLRDIPNHMASCSACKAGGRRRNRGSSV